MLINIILTDIYLCTCPLLQPHIVFIFLFISVNSWTLSGIPLKGIESGINGNCLRLGN